LYCKSKKVDVGFLPPTAYTLAHDQKAADLLLQAQRFGVFKSFKLLIFESFLTRISDL
jgi:ABC-type phosphate/phosphonate transport system substrate-binding protein